MDVVGMMKAKAAANGTMFLFDDKEFPWPIFAIFGTVVVVLVAAFIFGLWCCLKNKQNQNIQNEPAVHYHAAANPAQPGTSGRRSKSRSSSRSSVKKNPKRRDGTTRPNPPIEENSTNTPSASHGSDGSDGESYEMTEKEERRIRLGTQHLNKGAKVTQL